MREVRRQAGFSLLEVMFSVVVLTLGLIFVPSYFPLGLHMSREIAQGTQGPIQDHNAAVMMELPVRPAASSGWEAQNGHVITTTWQA